MMAIKAFVTGRRLEIPVPADWEDGTEVEIRPIDGRPETEDGRLSPAEIARTIAAMKKVEPLDWTDAEQAAWESERSRRIATEKSRFAEHAEELKRLWD